ncbi:hypothetical protein CPB84DRAFT_1805516 [Gymnopilus junonius]|uniref:Uncharacterized protein n=1 Tax=Gymnopilus junonius TaxID=109634 RepID=A0A9P5N7T6_GYMJU|nr:hypothetical protein CPB84DRAFT_1805516 [Gymnopilus junonius]
MESLVASEFAVALSGDYWMRPLYYKTYVDVDPEKNKKGLKLNIFCHPLIACGLGYHLGCTSSIPASIKSTKRPTGALIMAIQAPPRPYSDFSGSLTLPPYTIQGKTPTKDIERVVNKLSDNGEMAVAEEEETDFEIEDDADSAMDTTEGN